MQFFLCTFDSCTTCFIFFQNTVKIFMFPFCLVERWCRVDAPRLRTLQWLRSPTHDSLCGCCHTTPSAETARRCPGNLPPCVQLSLPVHTFRYIALIYFRKSGLTCCSSLTRCRATWRKFCRSGLTLNEVLMMNSVESSICFHRSKLDFPKASTCCRWSCEKRRWPSHYPSNKFKNRVGSLILLYRSWHPIWNRRKAVKRTCLKSSHIWSRRSVTLTS